MSLDDKLNPNDGSLIDIIDERLLRFHKKLGEYWQKKTYKSKDILTKYLHGGSGALLLNAASYGAYPLAINALDQFARSIIGYGRVNSNLEEEIQSEIMRLPRKSVKYFNTAVYGGGILITISGIGCLAYGLISGENDTTKTGMFYLSAGMGAVFWQTGNYLDKTDAGKPPNKPKRRTVKEWIKDLRDKTHGWFPQPLPQPALVPVTNRMNELYLD